MKLLAVPRPPPGPWDANAASAHHKAVAIVAAEAMCAVPSLFRASLFRGIPFRNDAMTISCDRQVAEDTAAPYAGLTMSRVFLSAAGTGLTGPHSLHGAVTSHSRRAL